MAKLAALLAVLAVAAVSARAIYDEDPTLVVSIDTFETSQATLSSQDKAFLWNSAVGPDIMGGERDLIFEKASQGGCSLGVSDSGLQCSGCSSVGYYIVQWDGADNSSSLDVGGLGGLDFTQGGSANGFSFRTNAFEHDEIDLSVYSPDGSSCNATLGRSEERDNWVPFTDFIGSCSFTNVGAFVFSMGMDTEPVTVPSMDLAVVAAPAQSPLPSPSPTPVGYTEVLLIDDFEVTQEYESPYSSAVGATDSIVGGERDMFEEGDIYITTFTVNFDRLTIEKQNNEDGSAVVQWDGVDDSSHLNVNGLGNLDFTANGGALVHARVQYDYIFKLVFYSPDGSSCSLSLAGYTDYEVDIFTPFTEISGACDWTNIGAIESYTSAHQRINEASLLHLAVVAPPGGSPGGRRAAWGRGVLASPMPAPRDALGNY